MSTTTTFTNSSPASTASTTPRWTEKLTLRGSPDPTDSLTTAITGLAISKPKKPSKLWDFDTTDGFELNTGRMDGTWDFNGLLSGDRADPSTWWTYSRTAGPQNKAGYVDSNGFWNDLQ